MDTQVLIHGMLTNDRAAYQRLHKLLPAELDGLVEQLKQRADQHWTIDPNISLDYASAIIRIGQETDKPAVVALGTMAKGDALKFLQQIDAAWEALDEAGRLFELAGDEVGWARTRIGRLFISVNVNRVDEALADAARAQRIFERYGNHDKLLRLMLNTGTVYNWLGDYQRALEIFHNSFDIIDRMGDAGDQYRSLVCTNIGYAHVYRGEFRDALLYFRQSLETCERRQETRGSALATINIADIERAQGHYRQALHLLHDALHLTEVKHPREHAAAKREMIECYLQLNQYDEARRLARDVITAYQQLHAAFDEGITYQYLALAEGEARQFTAARAAVDRAEAVFRSLDAKSWVAVTQLVRGRLALLQGDTSEARHEAQAAGAFFHANVQHTNFSRAVLLEGQAQFAAGEAEAAAVSGTSALAIAKQYHVPAVRYSAHLLLAQIHESRGKTLRALRHYQSAAITVEHLQRQLTLTLRPGFLEDKSEAYRSLIRLYLNQGQTEAAFETLERAKSQVFFGYILNRENLYWRDEDAYSKTLREQLEALRAEHHWFYRLANPLPAVSEQQPAVDPEQAVHELTRLENEMRQITEELYLRGASDSSQDQTLTPSLESIRASLDDRTLLVEFFDDGQRYWVFALDQNRLEAYPVPLSNAQFASELEQIEFNIASALDPAMGPAAMQHLTRFNQQMTRHLFDALFGSLRDRLPDYERLVIVPYGLLHYLPFQILFTGSRYLIEDWEVVIFPTSGSMLRDRITREPGAVVVAHSLNGYLQSAAREAEAVHGTLRGRVFQEDAARRTILAEPPVQVLHIIAHGEHRIDRPDLSFVELADGYLYTDDVLQHDMSYELVTLSACETGRGRLAGGEELIGLGRGFLYAGAQALITSMWRIHDAVTLSLMESLYQSLAAGSSKAAALQAAQRQGLQNPPYSHPAYWGAFQLIGDPAPLSHTLTS